MVRTGARGSLAAAGAQAAAERDFEPLADDEVNFVWRSLVDQGALSEASLQRFMLEVCGDKISSVQAKDLLNYMDADANGSVGKEDFRNFMSIGRLADTDVKAFMWHPNAKYRQEHGMEDKAGGELWETGEAARARRGPAQPDPTTPLPGGGLHQTLPARGTVVQAAPEDAGGAFAQSAPAGLLNTKASKSRPLSPGGRSPPSRRTPPARSGSRTKSPTRRIGSKERMSSPPDGDSGAQTVPVKAAQAHPKPKIKALSPADLQRIHSCLEKYEEQSWKQFLQEEEQFKLDLFHRFASSDDATEMTANEYHRMLRDWHALANWSMPGTVRPQDSLAALQQILEYDRGAASSCPRDAQAQAASAPEASDAGASEDDVRLPLQVFLDLVDGKFRPQDSEQRAARR